MSIWNVEAAFNVGALQGVCKGEGESGVSSRFHGFEGAAEAGEGADWIC